MNKKNILLGIVALALVIAGVAVVQRSGVLGSGSGPTHYQKESFLQGAFFGNSRQLDIQNDGDISTEGDISADDLTLAGRNLTVTTSNTSTSTAAFGCWETTSTSTATVIKVEATASTTAPTNGSGIILVASYGECSN